MIYFLFFSIIINVSLVFVVYSKIIDIKNLYAKIKEKNKLESKNQLLIDEIGKLKIIEGEKNSLNKSLEERNRTIIEKDRQLEALKTSYNDIETTVKLIEQKNEQLENEKLEWTNEKAKLLKEISYNIIQENIKQNSELQEKSKKEIESITKNLYENFNGVFEKISSLNDFTTKTGNELDLIKRALLNPTGAGSTSETTLSNILKASNLKEKISKESVGDYILQTTFNSTENDNGIKRPDCIIYLPNNNYLIIDSKSSKHFLELQKCCDTKDEILIKETQKKIKERMNKHLNDLKSKDYQESQLEYLNIKKETNASIITIMFLQTEKMLDTIRDIDPDFETKCYNANIYPLTPIGLINLLNSAKYTIQKEKQNTNFDMLKDELRKLFDNVGNLFLHSKSLGKSLEKSLNEYNEFANIFNKKILLRFKNMEKLGVESDKRNFSNSKLDTYYILSQSLNTIDSEAEEITKNLIENE